MTAELQRLNDVVKSFPPHKVERVINFALRIKSESEEPKDETLQVILDARNGIGLSEAFDNIDDLMEALNAED